MDGLKKEKTTAIKIGVTLMKFVIVTSALAASKSDTLGRFPSRAQIWRGVFPSLSLAFTLAPLDWK